MSKSVDEYKAKIAELNGRFPSLKASLNDSEDMISIEVATVDKAKACYEMFTGFRFSSGLYYT